jgi:hypothetical protein
MRINGGRGDQKIIIIIIIFFLGLNRQCNEEDDNGYGE